MLGVSSGWRNSVVALAALVACIATILAAAGNGLAKPQEHGGERGRLSGGVELCPPLDPARCRQLPVEVVVGTIEGRVRRTVGEQYARHGRFSFVLPTGRRGRRYIVFPAKRIKDVICLSSLELVRPGRETTELVGCRRRPA